MNSESEATKAARAALQNVVPSAAGETAKKALENPASELTRQLTGRVRSRDAKLRPSHSNRGGGHEPGPDAKLG